jgi:hypothetical protein
VEDATLNPAEEKGFFWGDGISANELKLKLERRRKAFTEVPTDEDLEESKDVTYIVGLSTSFGTVESLSDGIPTSSGKRKAAGGAEMERATKKSNGEFQCNVKEFRLQCAASALELMSGCGFRSHVVLMLVDGHFQLLFYDRSIVVESTWTPFVGRADRVNLYKVLNCSALAHPRTMGLR